MQTKDSRDRRRTALKRLIAAIGKGQPDPEVFVVFAENSARFSTEVFELACRRLEHTCEFFPSYSQFEDELKAVNRHLADERDAEVRRKLLPPADQVNAERLAQFRQDVAQRVHKLRMR